MTVSLFFPISVTADHKCLSWGWQLSHKLL